METEAVFYCIELFLFLLIQYLILSCILVSQ